MRAIDRIIEVKVRGWHLTKDNRNAGIQHEANVSFLRIDFDEGWDSYAKTVTFWDALMGNPVKRVLTTDLLEDIIASTRVYIVPIPGEAMGEAGDMTFVIDGYIDGKRKRSLSDTLWVKEAPIEEEAEEPVDPTPSQAEQLQVQIDEIKETIQDAADAVGDAQSYAEYAKNQADIATDGATYAQTWANEALTHKDAAAASADAAAKSAAEAAEAAGGVWATPAEAQRYAEEAETNAKAYAVAKAGDTMTGDLTISKAIAKLLMQATDTRYGALMKNANSNTDLGTVLVDESDGTQVRMILRAKDQKLVFIKDGVEYEVYGTHNLTASGLGVVQKAGDSMTGILTFDTPTLFSAFQKKRTIDGVDYVMRAGIGSDGSGASVCLRLFSVASDGTETVVSHIEADSTGMYWVAPGGIRKTVAHSGNIGVLTASLE